MRRSVMYIRSMWYLLQVWQRDYSVFEKTISAGLIKFISKLLWGWKATFNSDKKIILVIPSVLQYL